MNLKENINITFI